MPRCRSSNAEVSTFLAFSLLALHCRCASRARLCSPSDGCCKGTVRMPRRAARRRESSRPATRRVLPIELQIGDRLTDETGEYEIIGRPFATNAGKDVHARVKKVDQPDSPRCEPGPRTSAS